MALAGIGSPQLLIKLLLREIATDVDFLNWEESRKNQETHNHKTKSRQTVVGTVSSRLRTHISVMIYKACLHW